MDQSFFRYANFPIADSHEDLENLHQIREII